MFDPEYYKQEQMNQMDRAYDQISQYKVLHNIEKEIRTAQYMLKQSREQQVQTDKGKPD